MIGGIIGDIVGSVYEHNNIRTTEFPFFGCNCHYTDDTVLSVATAKWLMDGGSPSDMYYHFTEMNPHCTYGSSYMTWYFRKKFQNKDIAYNSCGNGSAMRAGPIGWAFDIEEDVAEFAKKSAECTHNHPKGIEGAQAVALSVYYARKGWNKDSIRSRLSRKFDYNLSRSVTYLQDHYSCNRIDNSGCGNLCQNSVPEAIICALDAENYEDAIRKAISIGGDSDTIACITGTIAEPLYGVPLPFVNEVQRFLNKELIDVIVTFENQFGKGII